jgi:DNA-directed RNA polymerase specialized sigma24 family protein
MDNNTLHKKYFNQGTTGYAVIRKFYSRYTDVLSRASIVSVDDVVHEVFLSLSKTDFAQVRNAEHYIMRAVKLHCWSLLDKAIRVKALGADNRGRGDADETERSDVSDLPAPLSAGHPAELDGMELLACVNLFKAQLGSRETRLLNLLIDGTPRSDIAGHLGLNINTLDTNIRRMRIRLADFLRSLGYSYKVLEKFD